MFDFVVICLLFKVHLHAMFMPLLMVLLIIEMDS